MKCPDCGRPMEAKGKDSSSGRDVREYYCGRCGLIAFIDEGVAWWRIIGSGSKVDHDAEEASVPADGILKIIRSDGLKEDTRRASAKKAAPEASAAREAAPKGDAGKRRKPQRGPAAALVVIPALLMLILIAMWTRTSWAATALNVLHSFAASLLPPR